MSVELQTPPRAGDPLEPPVRISRGEERETRYVSASLAYPGLKPARVRR